MVDADAWLIRLDLKIMVRIYCMPCYGGFAYNDLLNRGKLSRQEDYRGRCVVRRELSPQEKAGGSKKGSPRASLLKMPCVSGSNPP